MKIFSTQIKKGINTFSSVTQDTNLSVNNVAKFLKLIMVIINAKRDMKENVFIVAQCDKLFSFKSELEQHLVIHRKSKQMKCTKCEQTFTTLNFM